MHQRTVIRHAIVDALTDNTVACARVFPTRILPLRPTDIPAVTVYSTEETTDEASKDTSPRELERDLDVVIAGFLAESSELADELDALALEIETVMHADPFFGGEAGDSWLKSTEITFTRDGEMSMGVVKLTYSVTYRTLAPQSPTLVDDFTTVDARHRIKTVTDPAQDGEDTFIVQEAP